MEWFPQICLRPVSLKFLWGNDLVISGIRTRIYHDRPRMLMHADTSATPAQSSYDKCKVVFLLCINYDLRNEHYIFILQECRTDFEVLTKVLEHDPPTIPADNNSFSTIFKAFVRDCLTKDYR